MSGTIQEISEALGALKALLADRNISDELGDVNWTYNTQNERIEAVEPAGAVMMGFNAGGGGAGSEPRWRTKCRRLTEGISGGFVLAELVLISSHNIGELRKRYTDIAGLISLCADINRAVLDHHRPKIVFQTGFDCAEAVASAYRLKFEASVPRPTHPTHTLLKYYSLPDGTPWLAIRHPSSIGFSNKDTAAIRCFAAERCGVEISGLVKCEAQSLDCVAQNRP